MTALDVFALVVLLVLFASGVGGALALAILPGRIARQRRHPSADAIAVCGWWGLATLGVLLPLAWIWAFTWPPGGLAASEASAVEDGTDEEGGA